MFADVTKELCIVWSCRENVERFEGRSETYGGSDAVIDLRFSNFCYSPFCALLAATGEPAQRLLGVDSVARNGALYPVGLLDYLIAAGLFEFGACQRLPYEDRRLVLTDRETGFSGTNCSSQSGTRHRY